MKYTFILAALVLLGWKTPNQAQAQCPIVNTCTPGNASNGQAGLFGGGIFQVKIGATFTNTTLGATDGYKDYCSLGSTSIAIGNPVSFSAKTGNNFSENLRVYIDINNDQAFNATTELVFSSNNSKVHSGNLLIASGITGVALKMRVTSDLITAAAVPGPCTTPEFSQVEDYSVTLVENVIPPLARFTVSDSVTCNGNISFTDQSLNNPNTWEWKFGDGGTSNQQNPTHAYQTSGVYTVQLKVTSVHGVDSLVKANFIHFNDTVPRTASCQPITVNQCCGYGITRVVFNTIDNVSTVGSYQDFTCTKRTVAYQGRNYLLQVATNPNQNQDTKAWIDYNDNGQFEDSEEVFNVVNAKSPSGLIALSSDTAVKRNIPLRFRIMSEYSGGTVGPCVTLDRGQTEDYTITILENTLPPQAAFNINAANFCVPSYTFSSQSVNVVSSYHWFFGDGSDSVTTLPNVSHIYSSTGVYHPKLIVTGPYGVDSVTIENGVSYYGAPSTTCTLNTQGGGPQFVEGIAEVAFGTIKYRTANAATDGYKNYSCLAQTTVKVGQKVTLTVRNSSTNLEKVKTWIDWNNSGTFDNDEQVMFSQNDTVHTAVVSIPSTATLNKTLKMRVASNFQQVGTLVACGNVQFGQAEDYGIIVIQNIAKPVANFSASQLVSCTGVIQFTDSTENLPDSYHWEFGDGDTSNLASPSHTYATTGLFSVKLIVRNAFGADTLVRQNYISITQLTGMVSAACLPANSNNCCQYGIQQFAFAGINNFSGDGSEGNKDFTCTTIGHDTIGHSANVFIENFGSNPENVAVWVDWNNDGDFADSEKAFEGFGATQHSGVIQIPTTAPVNLGLRVRVKSDFVNNPIGTACEAPSFGQFEDYQIMLTGNNQSPTAYFGSATTISCFNSIQFADSSNNAPTSWKWYFGDGDSADVRNPVHVYPGPGTYSVKLVVINANGSDTLTRTNYITINDGQNLKPAPCAPTTVNTGVNNPGIGITQVTFGSINVTSNTAPTESYEDRACLNKASLFVGASYILTVKTSNNFNESCRAWIDWNNDGLFSDPAERVLNGQNARTHTATVVIPATAKKDTALRMRIISDFIQGPGGDLQPCNQPNFGQCEDYSVVATVNTQPPVAKISSLGTSSCNGYISFKDSTFNAPTSWLWSFGDNTTSALQNPVHQYTSTGSFTVKLKVTNAIGVDSVEIPNYVTIIGLNGPKPTSCFGITATPSPNMGTTRVRLTTLDKTSSFAAVDGGYVDYTCSGDSAIVNVLAANQQFPIIINTSNPPRRENCRVYIDFNNNGTLEVNELVMNSNNNNTHTGTLVGTQARCLGLHVRLRVITDTTFGNITNPCYSPNRGQVEDYSVRLNWIVANTPKELAAQIELMPNPATDACAIQLPEALRSSEIQLVDAQGKTISTHRPLVETESVHISTSKLPNGIYRILVPSSYGMVVKPLIIQH